MRGVARDSAVPTYDYHNFENSKRSRVTENAQVRAVSSEAVTKKKKVNDYASQALSDLRRAMKKSLPNRSVPNGSLCLSSFPAFSRVETLYIYRPNNIRSNERGLM